METNTRIVHFRRLEFQQRGSPHWHHLISAIAEDDSTDNELTDFIPRYYDATDDDVSDYESETESIYSNGVTVELDINIQIIIIVIGWSDSFDIIVII